jgi:anti-sigma B factor antagonist
MGTSFEIVETREGGKVVLALSGELDYSTVPVLEDRAAVALDQGADPLVLDVSGLSFMDSTGLRALLSNDDRARRDGRRLVVVNGSRAVDRIFALTNVEDALTVVGSLDEV